MTRPADTTATVIPAIRYRDAPAAVDWLCEAFGFERRMVVEGEDGGIAHAELCFGTGMVMLGTARKDSYGALVAPPEGTCSQGLYVIVADVDAHYERARSAGAEIVIDIKDEDYGGRDYTCRDPEGTSGPSATTIPGSPGRVDGRQFSTGAAAACCGAVSRSAIALTGTRTKPRRRTSVSHSANAAIVASRGWPMAMA